MIHEERGSIFLQNTGGYLLDDMISQSRKPKYDYKVLVGIL
jgi:hypothetical protein